MPQHALLHEIIEAYSRSKRMPISLLQRAWSSAEDREGIIEILLESLRKLGGFEKAPSWMEAISSSIPCDDIAMLYKELRSRSVRNELEWRLAYQRAFPQCKDQLPPVEMQSIRSYDLEDALLKATRENDADSAEFLIGYMIQLGVDPCGVRVASLDDLGLSVAELEEIGADELTALVKKVSKERGTLIRDYAVELGHDRIVQLLDSFRK